MIRFIMKRKFKDQHNGLTGEHLYTIDGDLVKVEHDLLSGGFSEDGYECNELVGVEVIHE